MDIDFFGQGLFPFQNATKEINKGFNTWWILKFWIMFYYEDFSVIDVWI